MVCCCSVAKLCLTLCDTMGWSMPGIVILLSNYCYKWLILVAGWG